MQELYTECQNLHYVFYRLFYYYYLSIVIVCASKEIYGNGQMRSFYILLNGRCWADQRSVKGEELKHKGHPTLKV